MGEEFSGLGSSFYIGLPGQPIEEMQEVKLQNASSLLHDEDLKAEQKKQDGFSYPITFEITSEAFALPDKLQHFLQMGQRSYNELDNIIAEATILMALWFDGSRCIARYNRLRRHYNRWRRSYATRKTFYAPKFNKFLHVFMAHYVGMRNYSSDQSHNED